jgi:membrane-bound lytic murein transglycosylase D
MTISMIVFERLFLSLFRLTIMTVKNGILGIFSTVMSGLLFASPNIEGIQIYQPNNHFSEISKQSLVDDLYRYQNAENIWDVLRSEFTLPHYENSPEVQEQLAFFMRNPDFLLHCTERAAPYLYYISQQVRKRHLPIEMVLLPMIESAYNPFAYSSSGAGGIWQIMPNTAAGLGIKQNGWYDGRRDVIASTKAALNYLVYLAGFFDGNWLLALAAYNTGEGNILAAIHRNIRDAKNTDFWSLPLSQQTRDYVPRLLALAIIIANPKQYPIHFPIVRNAPYLAQVDVGRQIDLNRAASLAGLSFNSLKQLNPGYNHTTTDPNGPYQLILPIQNVARFTENFTQSLLYDSQQVISHKIPVEETLLATTKQFNTPHPSVHIEGHYSLQPDDTLYIVRLGDNLEKISNKFHVPMQTLLAANNLAEIQAVSAGSQLIIPTHFNKIAPTQKYQLAEGDTIYLVRENDTIEKIAKKFHTTAPTLRVANLLASNHIQEGDRLVIPAHIG